MSREHDLDLDLDHLLAVAVDAALAAGAIVRDGFAAPQNVREKHPGDLVSDTEEPSDAHEHSIDLFSKRVGEYLEKARTQHRYDKLYLVAPPKFLGKLRKNLGREVEKLLADELDKDLYRANARELERYFTSRPAR